MHVRSCNAHLRIRKKQRLVRSHDHQGHRAATSPASDLAAASRQRFRGGCLGRCHRLSPEGMRRAPLGLHACAARTKNFEDGFETGQESRFFSCFCFFQSLFGASGGSEAAERGVLEDAADDAAAEEFIWHGHLHPRIPAPESIRRRSLVRALFVVCRG